MGFLIEDYITGGKKYNLEKLFNIKNADSLTPSELIREFYELKIEQLNIRPILKRYLKQILKELVCSNRNFDKVFLFEIREILQKVHKRYSECDFIEFLDILNELFQICVDKEISSLEEEITTPELTVEENLNGSIFVRLIQRQAITRLLDFNE